MKVLGYLLAAMMLIGTVASIIDQPWIVLGLAVIGLLALPFRNNDKHFPPSDY